MAKKDKTDALTKCSNGIVSNVKNTREAFDKTWAATTRAPAFCTITKRKVKDRRSQRYEIKEFRRAARLVGSHAFNIAASGAAMRAVKIIHGNAKHLRLQPNEENKRAPWMPRVDKGARMLFSMWLTALSQEATWKAHIVKECCRQQRLNGKHCKAGWDTTYENVFSASSIMPREVVTIPLDPKQPSKKNGVKKGAKKDTKKGSKEDTKEGEKDKPDDADDEEDDFVDAPEDEKGSTEDLKPEDK